MYKILAIVKFNQGEALILDKPVEIKYEKDGDLLYGTCQHGVFTNSYVYDRPSKGWEAFGGREFDIPMVDGSVIEASGQWWCGGQSEFSEKIGANLIFVTANSVENLKRCYVYFDYSAIESKYKKLRETYSGEVLDYYGAAEELVKNH